ncbi:hypothetical protein GPY51_22580 [Photorhabdus laumondii subsp. laumondii]|uniref:Bacteriophage protein n=1 Tax=Photorhabdus laumondii subsp. laumondii TaxID=141679 RepID=A0A6L9JRS0_PHOLM|nr:MULTISPECIES: hypothetical protein [Photorhabdus]MCC8386156.1 hypothetical protein [Photorhabdus laumondii]MCC8388834.1 hypothetical protein [Photorhabdus laumondii]MCC8415303.1 hypothetical protein [Photorhabdus laumondii]MCZ1250615.1 hypothetical protein [Photorhabdus laumondii subsp. laumondii]NDK97144.1 hypothetical protein [Photorhabdus laumondii subsp. laumondii]
MIIDSDLLRAALVCVGKADKRYQLTGVHISPKYIEATNGHVAVRMEHNADTDIDLIIRFDGDIPEAAENTKIDLEGDSKAFHYDEDGRLFGFNNLKILDGRFPDFDKIIPTEKQDVMPFFRTEYLSYPSRMFDGLGVVIMEPSGMKTACRFRFCPITNKYYGNPVFIVMPCAEDVFELITQEMKSW